MLSHIRTFLIDVCRENYTNLHGAASHSYGLLAELSQSLASSLQQAMRKFTAARNSWGENGNHIRLPIVLG